VQKPRNQSLSTPNNRPRKVEGCAARGLAGDDELLPDLNLFL
jgi:hypothetical protein